MLALAVSSVAVYNRWLPLWMATALVLVMMLPAGVLKWRDDKRAYGTTIMILSILVSAQGLHTLEHLAQFTQYHALYWTMRQSVGLLSPANAEWVHFAWNWSVLLAVILLLRGGVRNVWMWLLLAVAGFHAVEHTYTFVRYQMVLPSCAGWGSKTSRRRGCRASSAATAGWRAANGRATRGSAAFPASPPPCAWTSISGGTLSRSRCSWWVRTYFCARRPLSHGRSAAPAWHCSCVICCPAAQARRYFTLNQLCLQPYPKGAATW